MPLSVSFCIASDPLARKTGLAPARAPSSRPSDFLCETAAVEESSWLLPRHATLNEGVSIASRQMIACQRRPLKGGHSVAKQAAEPELFKLITRRKNRVSGQEQMLPLIGKESLK